MNRRELLTETALENLAALLAKIGAAEAADTNWFGHARIHFLRNYTTEPVDPYLQFHLMRDDIRPTISHGGYGTMTQELLERNSELCNSAPDVIVLSLLVEHYDSRCQKSNWTADDAIERIDSLAALLLTRTPSLIVVNTLLPPIDMLLSEAERSAFDDQIARLNNRLHGLASDHVNRIYCIDFAELYKTHGDVELIDRRFWNVSQAPFRKPFLNAYAKEIAYYVRVLKGRARKCLILDCDNTIWGGVIGEDGLEGIQLSNTRSPGIHYRKFQEAAVALHDQGVMLALCSKNNADDVWDVLENHRSCVLQKKHLVAWRINWENKAANVASLAEELNISLDSIVFVDDSPQEQALITEMLPEVLVLDMPDRLDNYADILDKDRLFDTTAQSDEDRKRTRMYQDEARRKQQQNRFEDLNAFLRSLQTVIQIFSADRSNQTRVGQLTQKTNQFNLTTRRYSVADIDSLATGENSAVYAMSARDRYGDMGISGVFIARRNKTTATIDTMLLSCRVLGRQLEFEFAHQCLALLDKRWPGLTWHAEFVPSRKNSQVADFWEHVGFALETEHDGCKRYTLDRVSRSTEYSHIITTELE